MFFGMPFEAAAACARQYGGNAAVAVRLPRRIARCYREGLWMTAPRWLAYEVLMNVGADRIIPTRTLGEPDGEWSAECYVCMVDVPFSCAYSVLQADGYGETGLILCPDHKGGAR